LALLYSKTTLAAPRSPGAGAVLRAALAGVALVAFAGNARAEPAAKGAACRLEGRSKPPSGLEVFARPTGGSARARLTGAALHVALRAVAGARSEIAAGDGFVIRGFVDLHRFEAHTVRPVTVVDKHVFITRGQTVSPLAARGGHVRVELVVPVSKQRVETWARCADLTLGPTTSPGWDPPGEARGYVADAPKTWLYASPNGTPVFTLERGAAPTGLLFFGIEQRGEWVRIRRESTFSIDAWARLGDLRALPEGERIDQWVPPKTAKGVARVARGELGLGKTRRAVVVRAEPNENGLNVGAVAAGVDVYVVDVVLGWSRLLPKSLAFTEGDGGGFWVEPGALEP